MNTLEDAMRRLEKHLQARRRETGRQRAGQKPGENSLVAASTCHFRGSGGPDGELRDGGGIPGRGSLFNLHNHQRRAYVDGLPLRVAGLGRVTYRGQELRGDDQAVWRQILRRLGEHPRRPWVEFTPRSILRAMGWGTGPIEQVRLRDCLERMQATVLGFTDAGGAADLRISLIDKCEWLAPKAGRCGCWRVWIEPELRSGCAVYFGAKGKSDKEVSLLAARLRRLFEGFERPYPRRVATLWRDWGGDARAESVFRVRLQAALEKLKEERFLAHYRIDGNDLVRVVRARLSSR